ncbi:MULTISPECIES: spermidine synthase [unclassified Rhizobium]|uniref:spermidine synthase n=1 Tax=unclassified Rhizobium TaxID=2613769 RepID=UPI001AD9DE24|nr:MULTISPECIES: hypothetical protein [unclassified Rhizobium]MBO9167296.1 hypothetical protein [Rhizobium sp. L245/93]MBO9183255.1 hypothetical protein [Rhizobium sp. E27B/91]MBO9134090.1 hypothetical protein [Rhizobium sp. B209b/85]QXZ83599.1 hypothetical protein J5287_16405 [Rhizobium sp. K1/93]QXZ88889.1 hypothetical protein J5280_12185 [Rhizobium sp. K15/93]
MIPWTLLDTASIPNGGGELRLKQRGREFSIMLGSNELMNSRLSGSEEALATLACERIAARPSPHLLIGGLGMGFTLRAALGAIGSDARVTVAELVPAVVAWARGPMAEIFSGSLDDPRVAVHEGDVAAAIQSGRESYDAILLDVDNGPDGLTHAANDGLYNRKGLLAARDALRPGGVLAVWSSGPDTRFTKRLRDARFSAEEVATRANGKRGGARHMIWIAVKSQ